jgi:hypothetical protein
MPPARPPRDRGGDFGGREAERHRSWFGGPGESEGSGGARSWTRSLPGSVPAGANHEGVRRARGGGAVGGVAGRAESGGEVETELSRGLRPLPAARPGRGRGRRIRRARGAARRELVVWRAGARERGRRGGTDFGERREGKASDCAARLCIDFVSVHFRRAFAELRYRSVFFRSTCLIRH